MSKLPALLAMGCMMLATAGVQAQSSSLYVQPAAVQQASMSDHDMMSKDAMMHDAKMKDSMHPAMPMQGHPAASLPMSRTNPMATRLSPAVAQASLLSVQVPEPRQFSMQDLVTIIVSERTENSSDSKLQSDKKVEYEAEVKDFPQFRLADLLQGQLKGSTNNNPPKLDVSFDSKFDGQGKYNRKDEMTTRVTARIIDIRPNGTLVLEARKSLRTDDEAMTIVITGTCRPEDITAQNTVLSTLLYDLRVQIERSGELRRATRKGIFSRVLDTVFNF